jgi:hypothetical protein
MLKITKIQIPCGSWYTPIGSIFGEKRKDKDWNTARPDFKNIKKPCFLQKPVFAMKTQKFIQRSTERFVPFRLARLP